MKKYQRETILESELEKKKKKLFTHENSILLIFHVKEDRGLCTLFNTAQSVLHGLLLGKFHFNYVINHWNLWAERWSTNKASNFPTSLNKGTKKGKEKKKKAQNWQIISTKFFLHKFLEVTSCLRNINYYFYFWVTLTILVQETKLVALEERDYDLESRVLYGMQLF